MLEAIVISDLHLGSSNCQIKQLEEFLLTLPETKRLILNGDVLESSEHRLKKQHWKILSLLRKLSDKIDIIWVAGNHDCDASHIAHIIGVEYVEEYVFNNILCLHGDQFDNFISDRPIVTKLADWLYLGIRKISPKFAAFTKRNSKTFLHCCFLVKFRAVKEAYKRNLAVVLCGHTHSPESAISYYNSGCWTEEGNCTYLEVQVIDGHTSISLKTFTSPPDSCTY